jgi:hypothetical protein
MISETLDLNDFVQALVDMDLMEIIEAANWEATEAERCYYRMRAVLTKEAEACLKYSNSIKDLITFMRYGLRCKGLDDGQYELLQSLCASLSKKAQGELRCQGTA